MSDEPQQPEGISPNRPLPWKVVYLPSRYPNTDGEGTWDVTNDAGDPREEYSVLEYTTEGEANLIVRAVNAYGDMLAALQAAKSFGAHGETDDGISVSYLIESAIAKATGATN